MSIAGPAARYAAARAFSATSLSRLEGLHPDLVRVVCRALLISPYDFTVVEGLRTLEQQRKHVASGRSQTMNSRHLHGLAVDLAPLVNGSISWSWDHFTPFGAAMKRAAAIEGVPITWGGDWTTLKDGPHFELPHVLYPNGTPCRPSNPAAILERMRAPEAVPVAVAVPATSEPSGLLALILAALRGFFAKV